MSWHRISGEPGLIAIADPISIDLPPVFHGGGTRRSGPSYPLLDALSDAATCRSCHFL
jgi:hypothetical protein